MLSGAYSRTYKQIEQQNVEHLKQLSENHQDDAIARAKRLQQETNRRRKAQAVKRKLEAQREEKRRQNILNRRREEQREATEKFQRSHVGSRPSSKSSNSSGKRSPRSNTRTLEETLKLVRGSLSGKHHSKQHTSPYSTQIYGADPLNRPYVNKYSASGHSSGDKHSDSNQNYLHNNSLRNLTNSRNLFEQQLEQHQQLLVDQQQRTLSEFNDAIKQEIARDRNVQGLEDEGGVQNGQRSESPLSNDSLEDSEDSLRNSCDLTDNKIRNESERNQQFVNRYNGRNDLSATNGHENVFEHKQGSPVNVVSPYRNEQNINNLTNGARDIQNNQFNGRIDSYDINATCMNNGHDATKPGVAADRPKVQLRAWATPSPVDSSHRQQPETISQNSSRQETNSNLYSQRGTTNATTTTAFTKATSNTGYQYTQGNMQGYQYAQNTNGYQYAQSNGETNYQMENSNNLQPEPQVVVLKKPEANKAKNFEFLETVTNGMPNDQTEEEESNEQKRPPASRVPRPVTVVKKVIPSKQIAVPSAPSSVPSSQITSAKTSSTPVTQPIVVLSVSKVDNKESNQNGDTNGDQNVPKLHLLPNGKISVLPDKPVMPVAKQTTTQPKQKTHKQVSIANTQKSKDDSELQTVSKAKQEAIDSASVKGILKRPATSKLPTNSSIKRSGSTGSMNYIKDSLEVAKSQLFHEKEKQKQPKKKSVRFADVRYSDDMEEETEQEDDDKLFTKRISVQITPKKRPFSAKPNLQTTETDTTTKQRASSATSAQKHKSTIRPQAAAHIITHNPPVVSRENGQTEKKITMVNNNFMSKVPITSVKSSVSQIQPVSTEVTMYTVPGARLNYAMSSPVSLAQKHEMITNGYNQQPLMSNATPMQAMTNGLYQDGPVYDENGMRIDRTPTDDEINFLWDKVRTCLQRTPAPANSPVSDPVKPPFFEQPVSRQPASMSHTVIDGAALGQMVSQARVTNYQNQGLQSARKTADPNGYQRRYGLLQRQKQLNPNSLNKNNSANQQRQIITYHGPMSSNLEPTQGNPQYQPRQDVGTADSVTAFLMAEQLAQQSISESQINHAMNDVQNKPISANRPAPNIPSALSIEERRLLESLDKLNDQLKISEFPGPLPQQAPPPQQQAPPSTQNYVHTGGFRGKQPITHNRRNSGGIKRVPQSPTIQNFRFS